MPKVIFGVSPTSTILRVKLLDSTATDGRGLTGLSFSASGLTISTIKSNEATATSYTVAGSTIETISTLGTYATPTTNKCRFREVDSTYHKGIYELQFNDSRFSATDCLLVSIAGATNLSQADFEVQCKNLASDIKAIDGQLTNGNNAVLNLKQLNIQNSAGDGVYVASTGTNGHGINVLGNGTGHGCNIQSGTGATGNGLNIISASTNGYGMRIVSNTTGALISGAGSGHGLICQSTGSSSIGLLCSGKGYAIQASCPSFSNGTALSLIGDGSGAGAYIIAGSTGHGLRVDGGSTSGSGLVLTAKGLGSGIIVTGEGSGDGINITSGGTGNGINIIASKSGMKIATSSANDSNIDISGGINGISISQIGSYGISTSGGDGGLLVTDGMHIRNANDHALMITTTASGSNAINIEGSGTGSGILCRGGATGDGISIFGGLTSGRGIDILSTDGEGIMVTSGSVGVSLDGGGGPGLNITGGTDGVNIDRMRIFSNSGPAVSMEAFGNDEGMGAGLLIYSQYDTALQVQSANEIGITVQAGGNNSGIVVQGAGTGNGMNIVGGTDGHGVVMTAGTTGHGTGLALYGHGTGCGLYSQAGATGSGIFVKSANGDGITVEVTAENGNGINILAGSDNGMGINIQAPAGNGIYTAGNSSDGAGIFAVGGSDPDTAGIYATGGQGVMFVGRGTTGNGMLLTRGGASGYDLKGNTPSTNLPISVDSAAIADAVWDEMIAAHLTSGSTGAKLNSAASASDPWSTSLPGSYGAGTAGKIIGDNLNATVSSRLAPTVAGRTLEVTTAGVASANITQINGQLTDGHNAVLKLKQLSVECNTDDAVKFTAISSGGAYGLRVTGVGNSAGMRIEGGATGGGAEIAAGVSGADAGLSIEGSSHGIAITGSGGHGISVNGAQNGIYAEGTGANAGVSIQGGATGSGVTIDSGASGMSGVRMTGQHSGLYLSQLDIGVGAGLFISGNNGGAIIEAENLGVSILSDGAEALRIESAGNSVGVNILGGTDSAGLQILGNGIGAGASIQGGATGVGASIHGGATSGDGLYCISTLGHGIYANGGGASSGFHAVAGINGTAGIFGQGNGSAAGIAAHGGATGNGFSGVGGANASGMYLLKGAGTGHDLTFATPDCTLPIVTQVTSAVDINSNSDITAIKAQTDQLIFIVDGVSTSATMSNLLSMASGKFKKDYPNAGDVTFFKQDNVTPAFTMNISTTQRTRTYQAP